MKIANPTNSNLKSKAFMMKNNTAKHKMGFIQSDVASITTAERLNMRANLFLDSI